MYATKRRRRNVKNYKHQPKDSQKSNPSKRHRERLNAELENLASLLPFEQNVLTKLDKLSILRLAVSYLRIKSYFQANLKIYSLMHHSSQQNEHERNRLIQLYDPNFSEGNSILESLNGSILIVNTNSEVFYASRTVEQFIGFHQSDIIHQSIFELIHSEDRDEFKKHLCWKSKLPQEKSDLTLNEILANKEYLKYLERNFTVRFRCLLDNTSGFLTLDIVGRLNVLHGQHGAFQLNSNGDIINPPVKTYSKGKNSKNSIFTINSNNEMSTQNNEHEPMLALFAIACPFGPPSLFEFPQRESIFKTKHKINLTPLSLDAKGKLVLGYSETEFCQLGGYDLVHPDDLKYYANAHKELLKTGSSGLICYRLQTVSKNWQWLQSSMKIIYKSNKPECTIANHRPLTEEEGEELFYKRGFEFKLPYPCLNDFEANFINGGQSTICCNEISNNNIIKSALVQKNPESNPTQKIQSTIHSKKANKSNNVTNSVPGFLLTSNETTTSTSNNNLGSKTKPSKYSKNQERCHTKHQSQHQSQLHHIYNCHFVDGIMPNDTQITQNSYHTNESNFAELNPNLTYKFNSSSNSSSHLENNNSNQISNSNLLIDNRISYYNQNLVKSELIDEPNLCDTKTKFNSLSNPEFSSTASSLSSSSVCSTSSSNSLSTIPADTSISINISNSAYHYGNYFNCLNQSSYGSSRYLHENQNKFYASSSSSSSSPFYLNSHNTTSAQSLSSQNSNYNFYNHHLSQQYNETINETSNMHSNNSCSSTSSISSNNSMNGNHSNIKNNINHLIENSYNNNSFAAATAVGILWPKSIDSEVNSQHYHNFNHSAYEPEPTSHLVVNNQLTGVNNYCELTNAKYSCGSSSNLYYQYPFVDDYSSSVSQI